MELYGEGNYEIENVKEITITDDFASMNEQTRGCQTESNMEDCVTQKLITNMRNSCKCLPYNMQNYSSPHEKV